MLVRQGSVYHFRRAVPARLRPLVGKDEIWGSLGTSCATNARARAGVIYAAVERYFAVADELIQLQNSPEDEERALLRAIADEAVQLAEVERATAEMRQRAAELRHLVAEGKTLKETAAFVERAKAAGLKALAMAEQERRGRDRADAVAAEARRHGEAARAMVADLAGLAARIGGAPPAPPAPPKPRAFGTG